MTRTFGSRSSRETSSWWSGSGRSPTGHDTTPGAVAVAWTLCNPAVDGAIVGFRHPDQVGPLTAAADLELSAEDIAAIEGKSSG